MSRISWAHSGSSSMVPHRGCSLAVWRWRCPSASSRRCFGSQACCRDVEGGQRTTSGDRGCLWGMSWGNQRQGSPCRVVLHRQQGRQPQSRVQVISNVIILHSSDNAVLPRQQGRQPQSRVQVIPDVMMLRSTCTAVLHRPGTMPNKPQDKQSGPTETTAAHFSSQHEQGRPLQRAP